MNAHAAALELAFIKDHDPSYTSSRNDVGRHLVMAVEHMTGLPTHKAIDHINRNGGIYAARDAMLEKVRKENPYCSEEYCFCHEIK